MLKNIFVGLTASLVISILMCDFSFAQSDVNVDLTTGGSAKCTFSGKVPFRSIKASNNNAVIDPIAGTTQVSIGAELDTEKNTLNANIVATLTATSDPLELLNGKAVEFESDEFEFSISKTRKSDGKTIQITNETPDGEKTNVTGNLLVKSFDSKNNEASGVIKIVFENTLKTIETLEEDIEADVNGKVTAICKFENVPVNFPEDFDITSDSGF